MEKLSFSPNERRRQYLGNSIDRSTVFVRHGIWSQQEMDRIVEAINRGVMRNGGPMTNRHKDFPTTDMPVYKLSPRAIVFLTKSIRERVLAPFAVRVNLDPDDLYFKDLFVVFYEASKGQRELAIHQDGSLFSFNIGLTNEFVGGGTYFPNGIGNVRVNAGSCVLHDGKMSHGGAAISQGSRWIIVGFVNTILNEVNEVALQKQQNRRTMEIKSVKDRFSQGRNSNEEVMQDALRVLSINNLEDSDGEKEEEIQEDKEIYGIQLETIA